MTSKAERSPEGLCESLAAAINQSGLKPEILTPEWLPRSRFLKAFEEVLYQGFKTLGLGVRKEVENPFIVAWQAEHPDRRISRQRADYILTRDHTVAAILEVESLDRAQVNTFMCQYYDWDNGKRDYYWLTLDHLVHHPEISPPGMFVFVLALPDCSVSRYQIWDTSDPYYG